MNKRLQHLQQLYARYSEFLRERIQQYALLIRLHRPIGSLLLGWPALWALWLAARGTPDAGILLIFILGVFFMRSAGCAINDFADREVDPHVTRTQERPIAAGRVTAKEALGVFLFFITLSLILVLQLNTLTIYLSFAAALSAVAYPFMKRFTYLPQAFLGFAFAWAVPMAWAALTGETTKASWLLFITVMLWAMAYDTMYAMVDREDDLRIGVKSSAILFGDADKLITGIMQACVLAGLLMLGGQLDMAWPYYLGLCIAGGFFVYQQYLIRDREPSACFHAFLSNNWFGAAVFIGILSNYAIVA